MDGSDTDHNPLDDDDSTSLDESCDSPAPKRPSLDLSEDSSDVASFIGIGVVINAERRYSLLTKHSKPPAGYSFPKCPKGRSFQHQWLQQFPCLVYSKPVNGGFCLPCVLFASSGYRGSVPGILVSRPLTAFVKALELLRKHADKGYHKTAVFRSEEFLSTMTNRQPSIQCQLNQSIADRIFINRQKLASIMKTIVFCGRQNIALRGHRDNATDIERDISGCVNHGNFRALLNFRVEAGDKVLGEHLVTGSLSAMYTSSNIQNQIIKVLSDQVKQKIISKVIAATWFTVIADEVTDVSNKEQLSLVLRYVDPDTLFIREDLVGFSECDTGITGRQLSDKIIASLEAYGLDLSNLRGQSYDGAGNMAGSVNGTAALITQRYPLALYLHCASHCLNLAVVRSLEITSVRNMMGVVGRIYQFFAAHPKRQRALKKAISDTQPASTVHKLKDMCRTRWVQRIDAIHIFQSLHQSTVACMEAICTVGPGLWRPDSLTDARSLQLAITTTDFLCALVITNSCLKYLQALTSNLQAEAKDIVAGVKEINTVTSTLQNARDNIDTHHSKWFRTVEKMCNDVGTEPSLPRRCGRQIHRSNVPADTPSQYYCRSISIPVLDHLLTEMKSRFSAHQRTALQSLSIVPSNMVGLSADDCSYKLSKLVACFHDLPSPDCIHSELHCRQMKWEQHRKEHGESSLPRSPTVTLRHATGMYPNIRALVSILCTLPVTSCSAERSFSGLKRIKTAIRSSMTTEQLTGLTLLHIHRDIPVDLEVAIDEFCRRHPRRMQMVEIRED